VRAAAPPVPDPEVVAKPGRNFTAEYKLGIVEEADRATIRRDRRPAAARGAVLVHLVDGGGPRSGALGALSKKRGRKPTRNPWPRTTAS